MGKVIQRQGNYESFNILEILELHEDLPMKFDVVIPTLNSESRLEREVFRSVLKRIWEQIPVNMLIIVDDGSKDDTVNVAQEFKAVVIKGAGSLGKAREIGINNVKTEWFYFIDDDNLITPRFHERMWKHANKNVGMIFAQAIIPYDNYLVRYETTLGKLRRSLGLRDHTEDRGYTGATLMRTNAVRGIQIPPVGRQEDYFIMKHCEKQGWKVEYASEIVVLHLAPNLPSCQTEYFEGYGLAIVKAISKQRMLASWLLTYPKSLLIFPYVRTKKALSEIPRMYYLNYKGYCDGLNKFKRN